MRFNTRDILILEESLQEFFRDRLIDELVGGGECRVPIADERPSQQDAVALFWQKGCVANSTVRHRVARKADFPEGAGSYCQLQGMKTRRHGSEGEIRRNRKSRKGADQD